MAKQRIAQTTNYEPLLNLAGLLGVNIKEKIRVARNAVYTSHKTIQDMLFVISDVIEKTINSDMKKADHYALMLDKTKDCTVTEQTAIHGRFVAKDSGKLKCQYLKTIDVLEPEVDRVSDTASPIAVNISVGAETLTKLVFEYVKAVRLDPEKMRGIGTTTALKQ